VPAGHVAKTLALHYHGSYKLVVIPASRRLDLSRLRQLSGGSTHLRLATEHEMERDFPDFEVGALPPFGPLLPARSSSRHPRDRRQALLAASAAGSAVPGIVERGHLRLRRRDGLGALDQPQRGAELLLHEAVEMLAGLPDIHDP
jgi:hypothetical protein